MYACMYVYWTASTDLEPVLN